MRLAQNTTVIRPYGYTPNDYRRRRATRRDARWRISVPDPAPAKITHKILRYCSAVKLDGNKYEQSLGAILHHTSQRTQHRNNKNPTPTQSDRCPLSFWRCDIDYKRPTEVTPLCMQSGKKKLASSQEAAASLPAFDELSTSAITGFPLPPLLDPCKETTAEMRLDDMLAFCPDISDDDITAYHSDFPENPTVAKLTEQLVASQVRKAVQVAIG